MSAGQPPRPGFPGRMPVRAPLTPGAVPQRPGAVPGARPGLQPRPMMPGARPAMTPAGAQPAVRPVQPRPMAVGVAGRPPMPTVGARPTAAGTTLPGAVRPGVPSMSPAQPGLQQVRPGVVPRAAMQPRAPSPVGAGLPPGARPVGAPLMARPTVPGQPMPVAAGQRLPVGAPVRPGTPPLVRPATGAHAPAVRPAAGAPVPAMRPASPVRPAAGAPAPVMRPATVRPTVGAPMMRPGVGAPMGARPAAVPSPMGVRPSAAPTPAAVRPSAAPAPGGVRPAAAPAPGGVRPGFAPTPVGVRPTTAPAPGGVRPAAVQSPMGVRPATPPTPVGVRPTGPPAPGGVRPAVRPMAAPTPVRPATVAPAAVRPAAVAQVARPSTVAATPAQTPAAPPAVPPAQPVPGAGGDRVSTGDLNMDDIKETFRQVFQGQAPDQISRADPGSEGTPCKVRVNMYPVTLPKGQVFHYDIEIFSAARKGPEGTVPVPAQKRARCASTLVNREVVEAFSKCYQGELGGSRLAFDGRKNLFTRKLLPFTEHIFNNVEAEVNGEKCAFVVRIAYAATVSFDGLHAMYQSSAKKADQFQDAVQVADVILRTGPTLSFVPVGRSFFVESDRPINLTGDREVWFGFYSSIRLGAWKPLVNIDMSATAFYSPVPLIDFAVTVLKKRSKNDLKAGLNDRERVLLAREIRTLKVKVIHLESSRHFRIEGLTSKPASHETFEMGDQQITVAQYFLQKYNRTLEFPNLPCVTAAKGRTMLPIEVCTLVKGQHCKKKLDEKQTQNMIRQTALSPKDRFDKIARSTQLLKSTSSQICQEFDMALDTTPIEIEARVLKPPTITYGAQKKQVPRDGVWKVDTFNKPVNMEKWSVAILGRVGPDKHKKITDTFQQEGHKLGMKIAPPGLIKVFNGTSKPRQVLEEVKANNPDVEMTLIVLDPRSDYGLLKAEAETTDLCMKTQCVKAINIETKFNGMFAANLLQKINAKLGGRNNGVQSALPNSMKNPYMAIGIDVNHPGPGDTTPSIAAVVASMDPLPSKYYACTSVQLNRKGSRSEYVVETKSMVLECLMEFKTQNKRLPAHIFIFRDGVADAQFDAVRIYELGAIRKACLEIQSDYTPGMTFIVVQKRHHVRFAPAGGDKGYGRTGNIHAGTIVDSKIVNPAIFDFYLCSHQGIQGTSRAAHYHVVHDDVHHSPDEIYRICYNLCHTYARCPRAVSIPAPAYYAHLAAFRAKEHIKGRVQHGGTYAESSSGSVKSSSSSEPDLDKYQSAQKVLNQMRGTMYFV